MKEQLRTEAENFLSKADNYTSYDGMIQLLLDFNAQQSKDKRYTIKDALEFMKYGFEYHRDSMNDNIDVPNGNKLQHLVWYDKELDAETVIKESQQSKPNAEAIDRLKSIIEACPKGSFFRKELSKVLKDLQIK